MQSCLVKGDWGSQKARRVGMVFRKLLRCCSSHYPGQGASQLCCISPDRAPGFHSSAGTGGVRAASSCLAAGRDAPGTCTEAQELESSWSGQGRRGLLLRPCTVSRISSSFLAAVHEN